MIQRNRNIPYSWIGKINIVKMAILHKTIYRLEQIIQKLSIQNHEKPRFAKAILRKKNKAGGITLSDF